MGLFNRRGFPLLTEEEARKAAQKTVAKRDASRIDKVGTYGSKDEYTVYGAYTPSGIPRLLRLERRNPTKALIEGERYTILRDPHGAIFDPEQRVVVVLNGETGRTVEGFLQYVLKDMKKHGLGLMVDLADYLRAAARLHFPMSYLQSGLYDLELRRAHPAATNLSSIKETVMATKGTLAPLELVYPTKNGEQTVRNVMVKNVGEDHFTAEHHRGIRRYRYDRTISVLRLIGMEDSPLLETPTLVIEYSSGEIRVTFMGLSEYIAKLNSGYYENSTGLEFDERLAQAYATLDEIQAANRVNQEALERLEKRFG